MSMTTRYLKSRGAVKIASKWMIWEWEYGAERYATCDLYHLPDGTYRMHTKINGAMDISSPLLRFLRLDYLTEDQLEVYTATQADTWMMREKVGTYAPNNKSKPPGLKEVYGK